MSKTIILICQGERNGCSVTNLLPTTNDNAPDILRGQWICPKCEKRKAELENLILAEEQKKQEAINNPGKCSNCPTKIKKGNLCSPCLKKWVHESFKATQENSDELNEVLEKNEESNNQLREILLEYLINLSKKSPNQSIEEIEADIKKNREETARLKQQLAENEQKNKDKIKVFSNCAGCQKDISKKTSYYLPGEKLTKHWCSECYSKNDNSSQQNQNNQTNIKCCNCHKDISVGENTHYFPQNPDKKWCDNCDPEVKISLQATQQIFQDQEVNIDNLNVSTENKTQLKALVKIKKGEQVDIDKLAIDEESKQELKELQKQMPTNTLPKITNPGYKYVSACQDCHQNMEYRDRVPSCCGNCRSKNIKAYDASGNLQTIPTENKPFYSQTSFWVVLGVSIGLIGTFYSIYRWKQAKKQGKKYSWWTDKIS